MPLKTESVEEPVLNLAPMIDIVFLLIIFFMVGTRFTETERQFDINLPTVSDALPLTNIPDKITVNLQENGEIRVNGNLLSLAQLETDLVAAKKNYPGQAVLVRGDKEVPLQHVAEVFSLCQRTKIGVSLAIRPQTGQRQ